MKISSQVQRFQVTIRACLNFLLDVQTGQLLIDDFAGQSDELHEEFLILGLDDNQDRFLFELSRNDRARLGSVKQIEPLVLKPFREKR